MSDIVVLKYVIYFVVFIQLIGLIFAVLIDPYINKKHRTVIMINTLLTFALIIQNYLDTRFSLNPTMHHERLVCSVIGYTLRPVIIVMWLYLIRRNQKLIISWVLVIINALIHMTAFFSGICFTITDGNNFVRGPLGHTCHIVSAILLCYTFWLSSDAFIEHASRKEKHYVAPGDEGDKYESDEWSYEISSFRFGLEGFMPIWCIFVITGAVILDTKINSEYLSISFLTVAIVSCNLFYYIWLHLGFVREYEADIRAQQRIKIMMSQIQPHFLFNTLSTIQALCLTDAEKASDTVEKFGTYLRRNIDSLNQPDKIPFSKELEHTKVYVDIEQIRFPSINVEYDISDDVESDFRIPALTIQPLVENAIRYGVRSKKQGYVKVSVKKSGGGYDIMVEDNGKGFDTGAINKLGDDHIGIRNVKERIESQCDGSFNIESTPGEGTLVTIHIP